MTPPPSELRAEELFQLSQTSLAAISGSGFTDPDPPVTPLVLEGMLASTNISVSILIDSGASLDAVSHNFAREHVLTSCRSNNPRQLSCQMEQRLLSLRSVAFRCDWLRPCSPT